VGGALLVPAAPLADDPPAPPTATLEAASTTVAAGSPVRLDSTGSRAGTGAIVGHVWDLDGNGSFETDTGVRPTVETTPKSPGPLTVTVRVVDDHGQNADAALDLTVTAPPAMQAATAAPNTTPGGATTSLGDGSGSGQNSHAAPAPSHDSGTASTATAGGSVGAPPAPAESPAPATAPTPTPTPAPQPLSPARMSAAPSLVPRPALARSVDAAKKTRTVANVHAAASSGVTIKNFAFAPSSSSVHVGDTITWTNQDQAPHTATASDGSFDTGAINQHKSGSHTFTKAGTFAYTCSIHPSMKGTVTVAAAAAGSGGGGGGSTPTPTATATPSVSKSSGLPHTGLDIAVVVLLALLMSGSGTLLRRRIDANHH
jgi:plastocyanin